MIGQLIFNLPEEREQFELAQRAGVGESALDEVDLWLRNKAKYEDQETISIDEVRKYINDRKNYWGI